MPATVTGNVMPEVEIVLQPKPVPFVQISAFDAPEQDSDAILKAVGEALELVALATTLLAAIAAIPPTGRPVALVSVPDDGVPNAPE